jgi:tetratricopeptide (TPR) repeat protein
MICLLTLLFFISFYNTDSVLKTFKITILIPSIDEKIAHASAPPEPEIDKVPDKPLDNFSQIYNIATKLAKQGNYNEAIAMYQKAIVNDPTNMNIIKAIYNIGSTYSQNRNYAEAIAWYDKAIYLNPQYVNKTVYINALNNKGVALSNLGNYAEAIAWYDKGLEKDPNNFLLSSNKGAALSNLGNYAEAIAWYDKGLGIYPDNIQVNANKAIALEKLQKYDEALSLTETYISKDPKNIQLLCTAEEAYKESGYTQIAAKYQKTISELTPSSNCQFIEKAISINEISVV